MLKITVFTFLLLLIFSLQAQITITKSNFPSNGDEYIYSKASTTGVSTAQTGTNQTWDYSTLSHNAFDTAKYVAVTSTPIAYQFYFNNGFMYPNYKANYAIKGKEINAFNQVNITEVFDFHKKNNNSIEMVGFGANINGVPASIKYDTIDQLYPLPLTYGVNDSTSAYYLLDVPNLGAYGQWIRRKVEVDGWGSLTTPYQTYNEAIRVKTTLYQRDTLKVNQGQFPLPGVTFNRPVQTTYEWFVVGVGVPVLSITEQAGTVSNVKYIDVNTSSIEELNVEFSFYPNPASDVIQIQTTEKNGTLFIVDLNGKVILKTNIKSNIAISHLSKGTYFILLENKKGRLVKQFEKL